MSIATVIGETLHLRRDGRRHVALCPFHGEKTPSFWRAWRRHWLVDSGRSDDLPGGSAIPGEHEERQSIPLRPAPAPGRSSSPGVARRRMCSCAAGIRASTRSGMIETYLHNRGGLSVPKGAPIRFHPRCQRGARDLPGGPVIRVGEAIEHYFNRRQGHLHHRQVRDSRGDGHNDRAHPQVRRVRARHVFG